MAPEAVIAFSRNGFVYENSENAFFVCMVGEPEMMDELGRLSDSTSEEHSIQSYTSESFDDNGE